MTVHNSVRHGYPAEAHTKIFPFDLTHPVVIRLDGYTVPRAPVRHLLAAVSAFLNPADPQLHLMVMDAMVH